MLLNLAIFVLVLNCANCTFHQHLRHGGVSVDQRQNRCQLCCDDSQDTRHSSDDLVGVLINRTGIFRGFVAGFKSFEHLAEEGAALIIPLERLKIHYIASFVKFCFGLYENAAGALERFSKSSGIYSTPLGLVISAFAHPVASFEGLFGEHRSLLGVFDPGRYFNASARAFFYGSERAFDAFTVFRNNFHSGDVTQVSGLQLFRDLCNFARRWFFNATEGVAHDFGGWVRAGVNWFRNVTNGTQGLREVAALTTHEVQMWNRFVQLFGYEFENFLQFFAGYNSSQDSSHPHSHHFGTSNRSQHGFHYERHIQI